MRFFLEMYVDCRRARKTEQKAPSPKITGVREAFQWTA